MSHRTIPPIAPWVIPGLMMALLSFGVARKVRIYEVFVEGARDGFQVALKIIPYLVAILVAVAMLRASGALEIIVSGLSPVTSLVGLPAEALPMALLRPLSGSGAYGVLASTIQDPAIGPDSYVGYLVSTFQGSTETTIYVLAGYFGVGAGPPLAPHAHRRPDRGRRGHRRWGHRLPLSLRRVTNTDC